MKKDKWIWMPHPAHFICSDNCRFTLATVVGKYIVSTVGELVPEEGSREISARVRGIQLEGRGDARLYDWFKKMGFEEIGAGRKYETMVFKAVKSGIKCCPFNIVGGEELDFLGYNTAEAAVKGHMKMCVKWSKK